MDILLEEHKKFLLLLLKHQVDFMLIGGYAVIYYGYERGTADMDIWLKPTNENRDKFILALKEHGIGIVYLDEVSKMDFTNAQVLTLGEKPNKIDILTKVQGMLYEDADKEKQLYPLKDTFIPIIQYHHLIITKMITGRPQDKADVDVLQKINRKKGKP
jgi:hypothetical protein